MSRLLERAGPTMGPPGKSAPTPRSYPMCLKSGVMPVTDDTFPTDRTLRTRSRAVFAEHGPNERDLFGYAVATMHA